MGRPSERGLRSLVVEELGVALDPALRNGAVGRRRAARMDQRASISGALGDTVILSGDSNIVVEHGEVTAVNTDIRGHRLTVISSEQALERIGAAQLTAEDTRAIVKSGRPARLSNDDAFGIER